jgi:hypothetical protein
MLRAPLKRVDRRADGWEKIAMASWLQTLAHATQAEMNSRRKGAMRKSIIEMLQVSMFEAAEGRAHG